LIDSKPKNEKLKILFCASEMAPYAKSGGLGDVAGSLPIMLNRLGADCRVVFPQYIDADIGEARDLGSFAVRMDWREEHAHLFALDTPFPVYAIGNGKYFHRPGFYGYGDDYERFAFFSRACLDLLKEIDFQADVVHFNDWQTGVGCVYLRDIYSKFAFYENMKSVYTIHNIQYQGIFPRDILGAIGLNDGYFVNDKLEFHNGVSFMKAGLTYSDFITTVSETYAHEIQTEQYAYGLDGMLRARSHQLVGIVNGIDWEANNPATDERLFAAFCADDMAGKAENKRYLQGLLGLELNPDIPMFAIISRLAEQKGFGLVAGAMSELMRKNIQLVIIGTGERHFEHMFSDMASIHKGRVSTNILFDAVLAQRVYAGADFFLMPSLFEPCGLTQLLAMRHGTLPIARRTGGLNDTVEHYDPQTRAGCGFLFDDFLESGLLWAVDQALEIYGKPAHMAAARRNAMMADFSWAASAQKYLEMYTNLISGGNENGA